MGVPKAKLVFQAKQSTGDYHGQMDYRNFSKWFKEQLLPNIPSQSLIFMDNAKYHNLYVGIIMVKWIIEIFQSGLKNSFYPIFHRNH